jgi:anaerobic magnesium-protoporphyrin IX monomethyl ester cyclase
MKKKALLIVLPYTQSNKVDPDVKMKSFIVPPYGILSIATYCKGVADIKVIDCNVEDKYMVKIEDAMYNMSPEIVGIGMQFDNSYNYLDDILGLVNDIDPEVFTVMGGAATLPVSKELLQNHDLDAVCYGDGEKPLKGLIKARDPWKYTELNPSFITWHSIGKGFVPQKAVVDDIDDLIDLDYSFVDIERYSPRSEFSPFVDEVDDPKRFFVFTSFGCPYKCSFCYRSRIEDRKMRFASVDKVIERVRFLVDNYGMTTLTLCDDQLLVNMKRAKELFWKLAPFNLRVESYQGVSVDFIDEEMAYLMKEAGMVRAVLPIESGCQYVLDHMVDKPVDLDKAKKTIQTLRKVGLWVTALFVCGFPGETDEHRLETMKWIEEADLDWCTFSAAIPIRGTKLYDMCIEGGYIEGKKLGELDYGKYIINTPGYKPDYVSRQIYMMNLKCNFVENRAMRIGDYETAVKTFRWVTSVYPDHAFAWYYLARAYFEMYLTSASCDAFEKFVEIIDKDVKWLEYAQEFRLADEYLHWERRK